MAIREYLTEKGLDLLNRSLAGEATITFTKMQLGSGTMPENQKQSQMTALVEPQADLEIKSVLIGDDNTVNVTSMFNNTQLATGFYYKEKGVFATDGTTEVLFSYAYLDAGEASWIPTSDVQGVVKKIVTGYAQFQSTEGTVNVTVKAEIDIDDHLSETSTNAVQNQIVTQVFNTIAGDIAGIYSNKKTYAKDDLCIYEYQLYKANQDIDPPEEWTAEHWDKTTMVESASSGASTLQLKVTFDKEFKGAAYTITGGGESYSGTVPDSLQVIQKVKGYNTEYTIKSTVGGASFENTVSTGQYAGEYTAELSYFIATLTVAADISGATVTDKTTITITDGTHKKTKEISNSVSTNFSINFPGEWSVSMTNGTDTSTTVKVTISDNGQTASASISYFKATLTVKVINGNGATVTATDGAGHTYTGTATSGTVALTVYAAGTYTVSSKLNGTAGYTTKKVEIKTNGGSYSAAVLQSGATFSAGSDEVIGAMIDAAQDGDLDLKTLWAVGDTRTITISSFTGAYTATHASQQIDIVITSFEDYNDSGAVMQFDMKDGLAAYERMNASNTGTYTATDMYKTVLPNYVNALPEWLRTRLHPFKLMVNPSGSGTNVTTLTNQKLALRSEWEVFGAKSYAVAGQAEASGGKQISYYATQANRIKKQGHTGSAYNWWLRSPYSADGFCICNTGGNPNDGGAPSSYLVAPFGCV